MINLASLTPEQGFEVQGSKTQEALSRATTTCDLDGDGIEDIIVGSRSINRAYVLWGKDDNSPPPNTTAGIVSPLGISITSSTVENLGASVACADMNQDGYLDLAVGSISSNPGGKPGAGRVYFVTFNGTRPQQDISVNTFPSAQGFFINGENAQDVLGFATSNAGDVNGDGWDDLVVSAAYANTNVGNAYVIYSKPNLNAVDLGNLTPTVGYKLLGAGASFTTGYSVSSAGDMNGDGYAEVLIGAKRSNFHGGNTGSVYVVFGKPTRATPTSLTSLAADDLIRFDGSTGDQPRLGWSAATLNFNGDGYSDIIFGAPFANSPTIQNPGVAYVVFGKANFSTPITQVTALTADDGFPIYGLSRYSTLGYSVATGDVNGDGLDDALIGSPNRAGNGKGGACLIYGTFTPPSSLYVASLTAKQGFLMYSNLGNEFAGNFGSCAIGKINNSTFPTMLVGASYASPNGLGQAGRLYGVYNYNAPTVFATNSTGDSAYIVNQPNVIDDGIIITDIDNVNMGGAQVAISTGFSNGDILNFVDQNGISGSYDSATGILTLTGTATLANYQVALRSVTFESSNINSSRSISFSATNSNTITRTLFPLNNLLSGTNEALMCLNQSQEKLIFPEINILGGSTLTLQNASITIANYASGEDSLNFTNLGNNIGGSFDNSTGILSLTGPATASDFAATLQTVIYENNNNATSQPVKTFTVAVNYAGEVSNSLESALNFITINDAPAVINPLPDFNVTVNEPFSFVIPNNTFSQPQDKLDLAVTQTDGNALPTWISLNKTDNTLNGVAPSVGQNRYSLFGSDICSQTAENKFTINAIATNVPTLSPTEQTIVGPSSEGGVNIPALVGGLIGGLTLVGGGIFGLLMYLRKKKKDEKNEAAQVETTEMEGVDKDTSVTDNPAHDQKRSVHNMLYKGK